MQQTICPQYRQSPKVRSGPYAGQTGLLSYPSISGVGLLFLHGIENKIYSERSEKIYDNMQDIQEILSFPDRTFHRLIDKAVLEAEAVSISGYFKDSNYSSNHCLQYVAKVP